MIRITLPRILMVVAFAALALMPVVASAAPDSTHFNDKFVFTDVTVTDAGGTTSSVTIRAASKQTDSDNQFTVCGYSNADETFLGQFESAEFASSDATEIQNFCIANFANRTA